MLALIKNSRNLRRVLLAAFVFSAATATSATESPIPGDAADHAGPPSLSMTGPDSAGDPAQAPANHGDDHANHTNHCSADAICTIGAWSLAGHASDVETVRAPIVRLMPRNTSLDGLRLRPELRPPRTVGI